MLARLMFLINFKPYQVFRETSSQFQIVISKVIKYSWFIQYCRFLKRGLEELKELLGESMYKDLMAGRSDGRSVIEEFAKAGSNRHPELQISLNNLPPVGESGSPDPRTSSSLLSPTVRIESKAVARNSILKVKNFGLNIVRPKAGFHQIYQFN